MAYQDRSNNQRDTLIDRLQSRRLSWRKLVLYTSALALLAMAQPDYESFVVGALVVALGVALRIWTFGHLEKNQFLTTTGPYAHSRNPAYVGSACILTGIALAAGSNDSATGYAIWAAGLVSLTIFFTMYMPRKYAREYRRLARLFPRDYRRHADNVPHFWPRLRPWDSGDERRFSWQRVRLNHEAVWPACCVVALAVMWF